MKIWHRMAFDDHDEVNELLQALDIRYVTSPLPGGYYTINFDISEEDSRWPTIRDLSREKREGYEGSVETEFTDEEIVACEWARLRPALQRYYPQPESHMAYQELTYRCKCPNCGLKFDQIAPFRIRQEAKLRPYDFVTLYWTYGIFCTQPVVEAIEAAGLRGIEVWPVMLHKADRPSETLSQLVFAYEAGPGLAEEDKQAPEPCEVCGVTKYAYHKRGYMRVSRTALRQSVDGQRTHEWFGSDTKTGHQEILISNRFARLIIENKWKGVGLKGVHLV